MTGAYGQGYESGPREPERARPRLLRTLLLGLLAVLVLAVLIVPLPFVYVVGPGSALPVEDRVELGRSPDPVSGDLLLLTVSLGHPTAAETFSAWLDDNEDVVRRDEVVPPHVDDDEYLRAQRRLFRESGEVASAVGLRAAGLPVQVSGGGGRLVDVFRGGPAEGKLERGDVVLAVGDQPVQLASDLGTNLSRRSAGDEVTLTIRRAGAERQVRIRLERVAQLNRPGLGVAVETVEPEISLPFPVEIDQGDIGGPSAGLMIALTVYDLVHPGDLTAGRTVAGTGTIDLDGAVGPVGGVRQKVEAAKDADADLFLVPVEEADDARAAAGGDLPVVTVRNFEEAVAHLERPAR
ncbi:MAG TPA: PDZ domain-containing protein [Acidimicrobiales bacterium]|nr:PDZ domain-containing protein [Acidimicrobiales bacterium]